MYRIEVNALPPSLNAFYGGMHWTKRKALVDEWHGLFLTALNDAQVPKEIPTPVVITITEFCKSHVRDADNAVVAAKFLCDSLKLYGYIPDDNYRYISSVILMTKKGESDKTVALIQGGTITKQL